MKCEIQWVHPSNQWKPTPDQNEAIGLCGVFVKSCMIFSDGCKHYKANHGNCTHDWVEWRPQAFAICAEHAKQLRELPNWWFVDFRSNAL
jgi:hypothetical protein